METNLRRQQQRTMLIMADTANTAASDATVGSTNSFNTDL